MTKAVRLEFDGPIAVITNDNVDKHNAFDDDMDLQLFAILGELNERPDVRAVIWRGEGKSFSSGRDVSAIGGQQVELTPPRADEPGPPRDPAALRHRGADDRRHAGMVDRRVVPAGVAVRHPCRRRGCAVHAPRGHARRDPRHRWGRRGCSRSAGTASRPTSCSPAGRWASTRPTPTASCRGSCRRRRSTRPSARWREKIAAAPAVTVKMARRVLRHLSEADLRSSMAEELIAQTFIAKSDDMAEFRAARAEGRAPNFTGS